MTWHYVRQGLAQNEAARLCRNEPWQVSTLGWLSHLTHLATLQPVGTDSPRRQALERWRSVPAWVEQEIANLREGVRLIRYDRNQWGGRQADDYLIRSASRRASASS